MTGQALVLITGTSTDWAFILILKFNRRFTPGRKEIVPANPPYLNSLKPSRMHTPDGTELINISLMC